MTSPDPSPDQPGKSPRDIAEHLIQVTRYAIMEDRFDLFLSCFAFPMRFETFEASREIETVDELQTVFRAVRKLYASLGVTHIDQRCVEADFTGPNQISFTHETRLLARQQLLEDPYPVLTDAVRSDEGWKVTRSSFAIVGHTKHIDALLGRP